MLPSEGGRLVTKSIEMSEQGHISTGSGSNWLLMGGLALGTHRTCTEIFSHLLMHVWSMSRSVLATWRQFWVQGIKAVYAR